MVKHRKPLIRETLLCMLLVLLVAVPMTATADEPMDEQQKVKAKYQCPNGALYMVEAEHGPFSPGALPSAVQQPGILFNNPQLDWSSSYTTLVPGPYGSSTVETPTQVHAVDQEDGLRIYMIGPRHLFAGAANSSPADDPLEGIIGPFSVVKAGTSQPDSAEVALLGVVRWPVDHLTQATGVGN